jgi:hypothetical protein
MRCYLLSLAACGALCALVCALTVHAAITLWQGSGQNRAFHSVTWRVEEPVSGEILPKAARASLQEALSAHVELLGATPGRCCGERMSGA